MASIIKKKKKNQYYYYLVESARVNGKPRIVRQKYLGRAENIAKAVDGTKDLDDPKHSIVLEFGSVIALYDLASRLGVIPLIDQYAPKREQGLSVGQYMLLAAINRAVCPKSKIKMAEWFSKTMLDRVIPAKAQQLSSQRFWDHMHLMSEKAICQFEDTFTRQIVQQYGLSTDCLMYDTTNFFTFIDTNSSSALPQRGRSKEKRSDLKIVGLAMMVSPDFNVPLFHETYPGNHPDVNTLSEIMDRLKKRIHAISGEAQTITLVLDKGNNSPENIQRLRGGKTPLHVVGSLTLAQAKDLLEVENQRFVPLESKTFQNVTVYRTTFHVYDEEMTVVVVRNPALLEGQLQGIQNNIGKCTTQLLDIQHALDEREAGRIKKGKKPSPASVQKRVDKVLQKEFMNDLFDITLSKTSRSVRLDFSFIPKNLKRLQEVRLGKTVLFTDQHGWSNEKIVAAYRSQYHIEHAFRQMKDADHLGVRPLYHWTDANIKVHAFYCVLAFRLCCLLHRELHDQGIDISINRMLDVLSDIKQVITVYPKKGASKKDREVFSLSKMGPEAKKLIKVFPLAQYQLGGVIQS